MDLVEVHLNNSRKGLKGMAVSMEILNEYRDNDDATLPKETITDELETVRLKQGDRVFDQEKEISSFYVVRQGLLGVYRHVYPDKKVLVHKIGHGESAGLAQLMGDNPYPGELIPIKETVAYRGDKQCIDTICKNHAADVSRLLASESRIHDNVLGKIDEIIGQDLESRIAHELLDLAAHIGRKTSNGIRIIVKLTRKQISKMVGCTQESVIRVMSDWEKKDWIATEKKHVTIKNLYKLNQL